MTLEVGGEDLLHTSYMRAESDGCFKLDEVRRAADEYGKVLRRQIVVRDARGETVMGKLQSSNLENVADDNLTFDTLRRLRIRYIVVYVLAGTNDYISFQQDVRQAGPALSSAIVLAVQVGSSPVQAVRLTRGGNVEVVRLPSSDRQGVPETSVHQHAGREPCRTEPFVLSEAQQTMRALVKIQNAGVRVELFMPFQLLETWQPIARAHRDFLDADEQARAQESIRRAFSSQNTLFMDDRPVDGKIVDITFLDVGETGDETPRRDRRHSTWTSRVRVAWEYPSLASPRSLDLHWTLFNAAVLSAQALVVVGHECFEHDFSTYDPHLKWTRNAAKSGRSDEDR